MLTTLTASVLVVILLVVFVIIGFIIVLIGLARAKREDQDKKMKQEPGITEPPHDNGL